MQYLVKKRYLRALLKVIDFIALKSSPKNLDRIQKILVCNTAHIGDIINMSYIISSLKLHFPDAIIGVLVAPEASNIIEADRIHLVSHYKHSRAPISFCYKTLHYFLGLAKLVRELRSEKYDVAIDSYMYFGNSSWILCLAQIHWRIGFSSGGFGAHYTHPLEFYPHLGSIKHYHSFLLEPIGIVDSLPKASLRKIQPSSSLPDQFMIIHPGSASDQKALSIEIWKALLEIILDYKIPVWITGKGVKDKLKAAQLKALYPTLECKVDQFSLPELSFVFSKSKCVVSVDSMAAHLACAHEIPCLQIFNYIERNPLWEIKDERGYVSYLSDTSLTTPLGKQELWKIRDYLHQILKNETI